MKLCVKCKIDYTTTNRSYCNGCMRLQNRKHRNKYRNDPIYQETRKAKAQTLRQNNLQVRITMIWHTSKNNAKRRGIDHNISRNMLHLFFIIQNWKCCMTGIPFDFSTGEGTKPFGPAIDRIDSKKGYSIENIRLVCNLFNFAKNRYTDDDVLRMAIALVNEAKKLIIA